MYCVVGSDGQVYGPVDNPTLQQWVREGRIVPTTPLIDANTQQQLLAADVRALQPLLYATPPTQPYAAAHTSPYFAHTGAIKSKTAALLFALFFGMLGVHRFYLGHAAVGAVLLSLTLVGFFCCPVGFVTWPITFIWSLVDLVLIASDNLRDSEGRPLA